MRFVDPDGRKLRIAGKAETVIGDLARVVATNRGSELVNTLIDSNSQYEIRTTFFRRSSGFKILPNPKGGTINGIIYADDPWNKGENNIMYDGWEISSSDEHLSFAEERAVSFGNYLREAYGMTTFRESYESIGIKKGDKDLRQFRANEKDKVSNFKSLGGNKAKNSFGFSYTRGNKTHYMIISQDKDKNIEIKSYKNKDEYNEAAAKW